MKEPSWRAALFNLKKDQSSLKRLIHRIACSELPYRFCRGRGWSGSKPFITICKMGRPQRH